jgi:hypothetical protein
MCVGSLDHLDNCKSFGVFNIFKNMFKNSYICLIWMLSNVSCNCGAPCENSHHFFFDCDKYTDNREILFNSLDWLPSNINIDVNLLTYKYKEWLYEKKIYEKKRKRKKEKRINTFGDVCWFFRSFRQL